MRLPITLYRSLYMKNFSLKIGLVTIIITFLVFTISHGQQIDLAKVGKTFSQKPVKIGGGVSASTIFYNGNDGQKRQPFTYFLNGNVNVNLFNQINLPFSFNFTNLGTNYGYPTLPNRVSVHPVYKWVTGHIGDVAMSFSPYTLNGHMFRGVGVDLTPAGSFKYSAMYGRLQRAVEYDTANRIIPATYERMGYAAKVRYDKESHYLGMSFFSAKDNATSLQWQPDSLNIFPQSNTAFSWEGGVKLAKNFNLSGEYGLSLMTRDVRSPREGSSLTDKALANRTSTHAYSALKAEISYQLLKNNIGVGYERIAPEYRTLGAYYFNNDYENITLRYARPFFKDKANIAMSWGVQRDDLDHNNEQSTKRFVSSANINYTPNEKLNTSFSYSNFQTHMNIRSQFNYINGQTPYDNLDTLNYTQLSQNMALNTMYYFGKNENRKQNLNVNVSFQQAADKQGDIIKPGNLSEFYNLSTMYGLLLVPQAINFNAALNTTYNHVGGEEFIIIGPTVGVKAKVLHKMITTGLSSSYNKSYSGGETQGDVLNVRCNATYMLLKKHNLTANAIWQKRNIVNRPETQALSATLSYAYSF
ncbi:MAG TPA: hypothetical protein VL443_20415 [Cyclobacteriaceae bacterium]|nr:hypothetical protein [Cyclobacteriaceae bacterium]